MADDKINEETYSLIFTSLKHPIRRSILRMLANKPLTYSEILETLNIDSGHLSYHLENLGDLTVHSNNGPYMLSSFGIAAVKLMGGVEEHSPASSHRRFKLRTLFSKVYPVILALALIAASVHLVSYSNLVFTTTSSTANLIHPVYSNIPFNLNTNETLTLTAQIEYSQLPQNHGTDITGVLDSWSFTIPQLENTLTVTDEAVIWIDSRFNRTTAQITISLRNQTIPVINGSITLVICDGGVVSIPNSATDPSNLKVKISAPEGTITQDSFFSSAGIASSPLVPITQEGRYTFEITNKDVWAWNGFLTVNVQIQHFEKPYFYWGVIGIIIAGAYLGLATFFIIKNNKQTETNQTKT
ncbi:MAG: winged helix-turn-helix domain-containing protein [Candidatus Bathyarchaeota archaeon]|nr:winged helix-turn-helix domain-containing protein [Candidatus Bathyarchaeum sp.]